MRQMTLIHEVSGAVCNDCNKSYTAVACFDYDFQDVYLCKKCMHKAIKLIDNR